MIDHAVPALFALFIWWLGTGLILYLDRLPARTYPWSLAGAGAVLAAALFGIVSASTGDGVASAYLAFTCGVALWGCLEMSYFMGLVTGPRKAPCPPGCRGWRRFALAIATSLYHEVSILASAALLAALTWGEPNQVGLWTFMVLWLMRWSAKLNIFLGVPNLHADWLPAHLRFLGTYMGQGSMNYLFPVSVSAGTAVAVLLALEALAAEAGGFLGTGLTLVTTLLALAILEHWFLVLPIPDEALWRWAFRPGTEAEPPETQTDMPSAHGFQTE